MLWIFFRNIQNDRFYETHDGVDDAVDILCQIKGSDLMNEEVKYYIAWCIAKSPYKVGRIFTVERSIKPDPESLLKFLNAYPHGIIQQYLHHLVVVEKSTEPKYHTLYALTLIDSILAIIPPFVIKSSLKVNAGEESGLLGQYRKKLLAHINESELYNKQEVLEKLISTNRLYEELIELYKKMGRHSDALSTIVYDLLDWEKAEEYCEAVYQENLIKHNEEKSAKGKRKKISHSLPAADFAYNPYFVILISVCARRSGSQDPKDTKFIDNHIPPKLKSILDRHTKDINIIKALEALPDSVPIVEIQEFLTQAIQLSYHQERNLIIKNRLSQNTNMEITRKHIKAVKRNILVTSNTICPVCMTNIGHAVFALFPDMSCVHYRCLTQSETNSKEKQRSIHPKTGVNFKKFPVCFD
jgi:hypothetical protein